MHICDIIGKFTFYFIIVFHEFAELFLNAPEGFVLRSDRPKVLRAGILGRYPPIKTNSDLVLNLAEKYSDEG